MSSATSAAPKDSNSERAQLRTSANRRTWGQWWRQIRLPALVIACISMLGCAVVYFQSTLVSGTELNARNWELREFSFRRDPFTNRQISAIRYRPARYNGAWVVQTDELVSAPEPSIASKLSPSAGADRWDLVRIVNSTESEGPALILVELLGAGEYQFSSYWVDWTTREPVKSTILWPAAQKLVASGDYVLLPDLFELTYERDNTKFKQKVADFLNQIPNPTVNQ
jgi:hypothetical protein